MAQSYIDDLLTCAICLDRFKQPKQLPCQHTFCLRPCLEGLVENGSLCCPECRLVHPLPRNGLKGFPNNLTIVKFLDVPTQPEPSVDTSCQECKKANCMVGKCLHCNNILCSKCLSKHSQSLKKELDPLLAKVTSRIAKVSQQLANVQGGDARLIETKQQTTADIEQWYENCVSLLQSKKRKFVEEVNAFSNSESRILNEKQESLETELAVMKNFSENATEKIKTSSSSAETTESQSSFIEIIKECEQHLDKKSDEGWTEKQVKFCAKEAQSILDSISKFSGIEAFVSSTSGGITATRVNVLRQATGRSGATRGSAFNQTSTPVSNSGNISQAATLQLYRNKSAPKKCFGRRGSKVGCFNCPQGVAVTHDDKIIVADTFNHRIQIFDASENSVSTFGCQGGGDGEFKRPCGVCVTSLYIAVADANNNRIQVFDMNGTFISTCGEGKLSYPISLASNRDGLLYVLDYSNSINVFSLNGVRSFGESWLDSSDMIKFLTATHDNKVVVAETANNKIGIFDSVGQLLRQIGEQGNGAEQFNSPRGVACDQHGNIIVADSRNHTIKIFDSDDHFISSFGNYGSEPGQMHSPSGVAVLRNGDIVVSDSENHRIQIF